MFILILHLVYVLSHLNNLCGSFVTMASTEFYLQQIVLGMDKRNPWMQFETLISANKSFPLFWVKMPLNCSVFPNNNYIKVKETSIEGFFYSSFCYDNNLCFTRSHICFFLITSNIV